MGGPFIGRRDSSERSGLTTYVTILIVAYMFPDSAHRPVSLELAAQTLREQGVRSLSFLKGGGVE